MLSGLSSTTRILATISTPGAKSTPLGLSFRSRGSARGFGPVEETLYRSGAYTLEHRPHPGHEGAGLNGLAEVVVSPEIQGLFLRFAVTCSQDDHRQAAVVDRPSQCARSALRINCHVGTMLAYSRVISRRPQPPHSGGRMRGMSNFS